ncbi:hypothetical protein D6853_14335 [Butyrivibrio sp. X503]|uniref:hypothetical protein n=1 Tax=Butyrivibrio sp. X503 TaxID=2364878 RepID=UPI000EA849E4|nr:hypothetical protein [Butyrivibrio sp. X503]RKM54112.1 hypothetical protein D6853_14335 [Butyrivibrio sp. X503]
MKRKLILPIIAAAMMLTACTGEAVTEPVEGASEEISAVANTDISVETKEDEADVDVSAEAASEASTEASSEASTAADTAKSSDAADSKSSASQADTKTTDSKTTDAKSGDSVTVDGTWSTGSIGYMDGDDMQPDFYVQFTDTEIKYGHKKNGEFVLDHSDKIKSSEKTANGVKIQAESSKGVQYTFQTSEADSSTLEYYETWEESKFADSYSGGASLSKCTD